VQGKQQQETVADNSKNCLCDAFLCLVGPRQPAAAIAKRFSVAKIAQRSGAIFASEDRCASQRQGRRRKYDNDKLRIRNEGVKLEMTSFIDTSRVKSNGKSTGHHINTTQKKKVKNSK
jgi:hypothetical protein